MRLECDTYYFYPNGEFTTSSEWNNTLDCYSHDIYEVSRAIRIFGTRKQIDKAFNDYCDASGLNVDECLDFKSEPKGSYLYERRKRRFGEDEAILQNKIVSNKLKEYAQLYKNKALIINLR